MTDEEQVVNLIKTVAEENNFDVTDNVEKIARAKIRFFGVADWRKCCCVRDDEHSCISPACRKEIEENGICDCRLYKKRIES